MSIRDSRVIRVRVSNALRVWVEVRVYVLAAAVTSLAYRRNSHFRCYCGGIYHQESFVHVIYVGVSVRVMAVVNWVLFSLFTV